jgi:serine/threonine-protein kinase HipA
MIKVWTDGAEAGLLDRNGERGSTFAYLPAVGEKRAASITMPVRLPTWSVPFGLPPIFEMNLPEGALRERLRLAFAKATGRFDEFDLLGVVGRSQMGRIRYTGDAEQLRDEVPFQSVDEILERRRGSDLFRYLLEKFAAFSGISGVQPKILVRDEEAFAAMEGTGRRLSQSYKGATHIVKFWEANEFPQLAANEYFCLMAARKCGLETPPFRLAEDGRALAIDRFDLRMDGTYRGFEDFCALNARRTEEKYRGSYETSVMKRFSQFAASPRVNEDLEKLFTLIVLNCAVRNGDAHLKNFGMVYDDVQGEARLSPVYDVVTTSVYLPKDSLALTLNGTVRWPSAKELKRLGETRAGCSPAKAREILGRVEEAMREVSEAIGAHGKKHPEFAEVGGAMVREWEAGMAGSLRG